MKRVVFDFIVWGMLGHGLMFGQQTSSATTTRQGAESNNIVNGVYSSQFLGFSFPIQIVVNFTLSGG